MIFPSPQCEHQKNLRVMVRRHTGKKVALLKVSSFLVQHDLKEHTGKHIHFLQQSYKGGGLKHASEVAGAVTCPRRTSQNPPNAM